ncbi:MAG: signal peptide peptidase SppA [Phycisphaerae bacterium]|nr:signal peptide peptidase SppA [Phycisphaerae bacterium]MDW8261966.1 signal peptide peptidase SppA [Phycisphaerales bacterium]
MSMFPQPPPGQGPIHPGAGAPSPYPPMMPPMPYPPVPPEPRSGGGWVRAIFVTLATTIFGLSLTLNIYLLIYTGLMRGGMGGSVTSVVRDGKVDQTIAVVPIRGIITQQTFEQFARWMNAIEEDSRIKGLILEVDTPGGEVAPSDQIHQRIVDLKKKRGIPVVVSMGGYATSGGYYVSAPADHIVAQPTTWTGSIGVRLDRLNISRLADKYGIEDNSLHATGSDFKTAGSIWKPETPEERAYLLGLVDDAYRIFTEVVQKGRGSKLTAPMNVIASGKVFTAMEASKLGLVDQVGYFDDAVDKAIALANLNQPRVIRYSRPPSLWESLGVESAEGIARNALHWDRSVLDELLRPRLMYHWNGS